MPGRGAATIETIAVTGACAAERRSYAMRLARERGFIFVPAEQTAQGVDAVDRMIELVATAFRAPGVILEYPLDVPVMEIVGALTAPVAGTRLTDLVCVLDVGHLIADLESEALIGLPQVDEEADPEPCVVASRAELLMAQIEFASTVAIVNAQALESEELTRIRALISHLAPEAYLALIDGGETGSVHVPAHGTAHAAAHGPAQGTVHGPVRWSFDVRPPTAGWVSILNDEFWPQSHARGVVACRYEQPRAFHPGRLHRVLTSCLAQGRCGRILRSAGFARLATRSHITAQWDQVGNVFTLSPVALDDDLGAGDEILAFGQDLAFFGIGIDQPELRRVLDEAVLTDEEFAAGPMGWAKLPDAFPEWRTARR